MMGAPAVEVENLSRTFGSRSNRVHALDDVSLRIETGEVVGLLGENGAGKTTLTKILATLLLPTSGAGRIFGHDLLRDLAEVRRLTGVVLGGDRGLYGKLSGRDNLRFFAVLGGARRRGLADRVARSLDQVGLADAADRAVETYSKGMRQRLHVAIGLFNRPSLLLLDEPTVGLDPVEAQRLRTSIAALRTGGVSVLLTSHQLLDIERLADRVVLLDQGRIAADLGVDEFARLGGYVATIAVRGTGPRPSADQLDVAAFDADAVENTDGGWLVRMRVREWGFDALSGLGRALGGVEVTDVRVDSVRMEDVYGQVMCGLESARNAGPRHGAASPAGGASPTAES